MSNPERPTIPQFSDVSELLISIAHQASELDSEAQRRLDQDRDTPAYQEVVRERARLIQALPTTLAEYRTQGGAVPEDVEHFAFVWSFMAGQSLDSDNMFGMGALLTPMGAKADEPNELEKLAMLHAPFPGSEA
jgi:hypothetical protein